MSIQSLQPLVISKNVVNVHLEPSGDTELVTQGMLGQPAWLLETKDKWIRVQLWDTYTGWLQDRFTAPLESGMGYPAGFPFVRVRSLIADVLKAPKASADIVTKLPVSAECEPGDRNGAFQEIRLPNGTNAWVRSKDVDVIQSPEPRPERPSGDKLVRTAKRLIGTPYLWGGTTPFGIDCSGLVQLCYRLSGFQLLRDAGIQANDPRAKPADPDKLRKGDLVFFCGAMDTKREHITHVGMYIGGGEFIHSAGQSVGVTISPLFSGYYWDVFWGARRMDFTGA